jgi:hypothetical protein
MQAPFTLKRRDYNMLAHRRLSCAVLTSDTFIAVMRAPKLLLLGCCVAATAFALVHIESSYLIVTEMYDIMRSTQVDLSSRLYANHSGDSSTAHPEGCLESNSTTADLQNIDDLRSNEFLSTAWPYVMHFVIRPYGCVKTGLSELFSNTKRVVEAHGVKTPEGLQLVELATFVIFTAVLRLAPLDGSLELSSDGQAQPAVKHGKRPGTLTQSFSPG